jgi:predicted nucleic acid-binding protein
MNRYVLDACALIALLQDEKGADEVADVFEAAENGTAAITMHKLNLLEVYYKAYRTHGKERANRMLEGFKKRPVLISQEIGDELFMEAGRFKGTYTISFADSIVLAQASILNAELLTADHHEFDAIEKSESIRFRWIR